MSSIALANRPESPQHGAWLFAASFMLIAVSACFLSGWAPLGFSIVTVFLFAGPHNWIEARYFMSRMPGRWGRLWSYYTIGIGGVVVLALTSLVLPSLASSWSWQQADWQVGLAIWNTILVAWIMLLVIMRQRERESLNWSWFVPLGFALIALNWMWPMAWSLGLVYLHPLIAFWFLDRELRRRRPQWQRAYRACLLLIPLLVGVLWWRLAATENLPGTDMLIAQITNHAGSNIASGVSSRLLVATHTFLEMLHYAVWLIAIPLVAMRVKPWRLDDVALAKSAPGWKVALVAILILGATITLVLWAGFLADYPLTRNIYFSVAIFHVLAEAPFLLRLL
jgi:hypothetical protein